ncbi:hypothetical protein DFQ28_011185 [Apophysomyces sp. BC1034]|nr:hypothetical protein DFQ30_008418 [Apophysomyces sp. BC1015]KAG0182661.1 hypothetical protein DFQ29_002993 [Apophysomyces sp. BC1021]KAG0191710.1 hypothetical protein DFQ28_011185 [Apophysomyces sp. BC1034]
MGSFAALADLNEDNEPLYESGYEEVQFFRFNGLVPDAKISLQDSPFNRSNYGSDVSLLACSSQYGYFVAGSVTGFVFGSLKTLRSTFYSAGKGECLPLPDKTTVPIEQGPVCQLRLSADELQVIVAVAGGLLLIFDVQDIVNNKEHSKPIKALQIGAHILDLRPNPEALPNLAALRLEGDVCIIIDLVTGETTATISDDKVTAVCWSPKGKQLVGGTRDGTIYQYDVHGVKKATVEPPEEMRSGFGQDQDTRYGKLNNSLDQAMLTLAFSDDHATDAYIVERAQTGNVSYIPLSEVCPVYDTEAPESHYYMETIRDFGNKAKHVIVVANAATNELYVVGQGENGQWATWSLEENAGVTLPLCEETSQDTLPLGIAIDFSVSEPLPPYDPSENDNSVYPMPVLYYINDEGIIGAHHCYSLELAQNGEKYSGMIQARELSARQGTEHLETAPLDTTPAAIVEQKAAVPTAADQEVEQEIEQGVQLEIRQEARQEARQEIQRETEVVELEDEEQAPQKVQQEAEVIELEPEEGYDYETEGEGEEEVEEESEVEEEFEEEAEEESEDEAESFEPSQFEQVEPPTAAFGASPFGAAIQQQDNDAFSNLLSGTQSTPSDTTSPGFNVTPANKLPAFSSLGSAAKSPNVGFGFGSASSKIPSFSSLGSAPKAPSVGFGFGSSASFGGFATTSSATNATAAGPAPTFGSTSLIGAGTSAPTVKAPTFGSNLVPKPTTATPAFGSSLTSKTTTAPAETKSVPVVSKDQPSVTQPPREPIPQPTSKTLPVTKQPTPEPKAPSSTIQPVPKVEPSPASLFDSRSSQDTTTTTPASKPLTFGAALSKPATGAPAFGSTSALGTGLKPATPAPAFGSTSALGTGLKPATAKHDTQAPQTSFKTPMLQSQPIKAPSVDSGTVSDKSPAIKSLPSAAKKESPKPKTRQLTAEETMAREFETAYFDIVDAMKKVEMQYQDITDTLNEQAQSLPVAKSLRDLENEKLWKIGDTQVLTQMINTLATETKKIQSDNGELEKSLHGVEDKALKLHVRAQDIQALINSYSSSDLPKKNADSSEKAESSENDNLSESFVDVGAELPLDIEVQELHKSLQKLTFDCENTLDDLENKVDRLKNQNKQRKALLGKDLSLYALRRIMRDVERDIKEKDIEVKDLEEEFGRQRLMEYQKKASRAQTRIVADDVSDEDEESDATCAGLQVDIKPFSDAVIETTTNYLRRERFLDSLHSAADTRKPLVHKA